MKKFSPKETTLLKVVLNILHKRPWEFGVVLEDEGWLSIKELQKVLKEEGIKGPSAKGLIQFFEVYRPEGIELIDGKIRAVVQGATAPPTFGEAYPPDTLYLGIRERAIESIREHGIDGKRQKIILSASKEMAQRIIARKTSKYIIIEINSKAAQARGIYFESLGGSLFSCPFILPQWMKLPEKREEELERGKEAKGPSVETKKEPQKQTAELPGSFYLGLDPSEIHYLEQKAKGRRRRWDRSHKKGKRRK